MKCRLDKSQAGIKFAWRNINNLRYANDTSLMAESEEYLKSFLTLAAWKESYTNLNSILKSRDITLPTKVHIVKVVGFPVVMCRYEVEHKEG